MLRRTGWVALLLLLATTAPALGQVRLHWKFKEGETFYVEERVTLKRADTIAKKAFKQDVTTDVLSRFTVVKTGKETILDERIERIKVTSVGDNPTDPTKRIEKLKGALFTITLGPTGKVNRFQGYDELVQKLAAGSQDEAKLVRLALKQDALREKSRQLFDFLPTKPVSKGSKWHRDATIRLDQLGSFTSKTHYTVRGRKDGKELIDVTMELTYHPPKAVSEDDAFKVVKGTLTASGKGHMVFDTGAGRLVSYNQNLHYRGSLVLSGDGKQLPISIDNNQTIAIRVRSSPPGGG